MAAHYEQTVIKSYGFRNRTPVPYRSGHEDELLDRSNHHGSFRGLRAEP